MAFVPAENVAEIVLQGLEAGQVVDNVINVQMPDAMTTTILDALANSVIGAFVANILPMLSNVFQLISVKATDLTTASSPSVTRFPATTAAGAVGGTAAAINAALVLSEATDARGRSFRGRLYMGGMPQSALTDAGAVTNAYRDDFVLKWIDFFDDVEDDNGCIHVVLSRETAGTPRTAGVATEITTYSANVDLDSQRKRLKGRGA